MGKIRSALSFSVNNKVSQIKAAVNAQKEIEKCPVCYLEVQAIEQCAAHGHQTGKAPDLSTLRSQAKHALKELIEIQKCPDCKEKLAGINFHAKLGHPRVE